MQTVQPTGRERSFGRDEIIVSKTDTRGVITYANPVFLRLADLTEAEAVGAPHAVIRHPDMPRGVFKMLWDRVQAGQEVFAYVVNMARNGDHYWVLAHVTPTFDESGRICGYHSNRRAPDRRAVEEIQGLYAEMRRVEDAAGGKASAAESSVAALTNLLAERGVTYDEYIFSR
ncbi:aerotaxis receptor [Phenylobacterium zucineum HLK1]|uniref:Aerotaxis receptor n=1 Tax=Phenylobacterium zucineum (strain HLK1) TaxID=450851 RepID=B4REB6_PHEZH|nr:PAS domain-containing protein [Phenylobacterium zucineum]ACG76858.1 aerotaxis receptor [Phenylobacterium zucineum HLK1]